MARKRNEDDAATKKGSEARENERIKMNSFDKNKLAAEQCNNNDNVFFSDQSFFRPNNNHPFTTQASVALSPMGDEATYNWCRVLKPVSIKLLVPDASAVAVQ